MECSEAHGRRALEALPDRFRVLAGRAVRVGAEAGGGREAGAVVYTLTDPPAGVDPGEWLAWQCELPPSVTGDHEA
jgi:hypothetical protein